MPQPLTVARAATLAAMAVLAAACAGNPPPPPVAMTPGCLSDAKLDDWITAHNARTPAVNPPES
ncbi:MAG: hypothetical protein KDF56_18375, partial [Ottowia sp.]|nr:hypothetical protein [Ottowia sp.]